MKSFFQNLIIFLCVFDYFIVYSQPTIVTSKCFGGTLGEGASCIINTSDGGLLIIASTSSNDGDVSGAHSIYDSINQNWYPGRDVWILKLDYAGSILWQKCFGGWDLDEGVKCIEVTGGYVVISTSGSSDGDLTFNNGDADFWIFKISYSGNIIWQHSFGGTSTENVYSIATSPDGGLLIAGSENSINDGDVMGHHGSIAWDAWLLKLDSLGNLQWQKCLGGTQSELYQQIQCDSLGYIYYVSVTASTDDDVTCNVNYHNIWLTKLDSSGSILWDRCFGGTGIQYIWSMKLYSNRILMAGSSSAADGDLNHNYGYADAWVLLTDTSGNKLLSESYGGSLTDEFYSAILTSSNTIIAGGKTMSSDFDVTMNHPGFNNVDGWIAIIDSTGSLLWQNTYGGSRSEEIKSLIVDSTQNIVFTGYTNTNNDGDIIDYHGITAGQVWFVKLDLSLGFKSSYAIPSPIKFYPNPFTDQIQIQSIPNTEIKKINLIDSQGKIIKEIRNSSDNSFTLGPGVHPGIYVFQFICDTGIYNLTAIKLQ